MNNRKTLFLVFFLALITSSCKQKSKVTSMSQTQTDTLSTQLTYGGTYTFGGNSEGAPNGIAYIYPENDSTLLFYLNISKGAPSYNCGEIDGRITVKDGRATFRQDFDYGDNDCLLYFEFTYNAVTIIEDEKDCQCGFGSGVYINDIFQRTNSEIPQYYTTLSNDTIFFGQWQTINDNSVQENDETIIREEDLANDDVNFLIDSDWEGLTYEQYQEDDGYTTIQEYNFPGATMQQVYAIAKQIDTHLKNELPDKDLKYTEDDGNITLTYQYKTPENLHIELEYPGGTTYMDIIKKESSTLAKITFAAD